MKQLFRCEYCDKIGVAEEIAKHEADCFYNHNKKSCYTCKHADNASLINYTCKAGKVIPEGKIFECCHSYEREEKEHTSRNPVAANSMFGGLFGP